MALLKDLYSPAFYERFSAVAKNVVPGFDPRRFEKDLFVPQWKQLELKERMKHTATVLRRFMPDDFTAAALLLEDLVTALQQNAFIGAALEFMFLPHYVEAYGIDHPEAAIRAFEIITPFSSCEFAVRPFIHRYPGLLYRQLLYWASHPNHHVRRLAAEGSRPRLPWAMALPALKKDPSPTLPVLELLKQDASEYVRRSVANHLNDITKDHPAVVIKLAGRWAGQHADTDAIIKHGCRSLLKQGNADILALYQLKATHFGLSDLRLTKKKIRFGDAVELGFSVSNQSAKPQVLRLEYALYFLRKNKTYYRKVFKISERTLGRKETIHWKKKHAFKPITTRQYYAGKHEIGVIINGQEKGRLPFVLQE